jgi:hypothetical protein
MPSHDFCRYITQTATVTTGGWPSPCARRGCEGALGFWAGSFTFHLLSLIQMKANDSHQQRTLASLLSEVLLRPLTLKTFRPPRASQPPSKNRNTHEKDVSQRSFWRW